MNYPFEFKAMLLTDKALDVLGFSEYWAGCGDFGERCFGVQGVELYRLVEMDENDDPDMGYGNGIPEYYPCHYGEPFTSKDSLRHIYFLHELYDSIESNNPNLLNQFISKTKAKNVNMFPYIESYLEYKNKQNG